MDLDSYEDLQQRKIARIFSYELKNSKHGEVKSLPQNWAVCKHIIVNTCEPSNFFLYYASFTVSTVIGEYQQMKI